MSITFVLLAWNHRSGADGALKQPGLISTGCHCTFREFEPLEEYRSFCPYILITSKGPHSHPIPLPQKTPARVKLELTSLFEKLDVDLADLTPRKFIRHPIVQYYLSSRFPMLRNPMLSDLHISLSNRSHLKVYIEQAKKVRFPRGTGWKGRSLDFGVFQKPTLTLCRLNVDQSSARLPTGPKGSLRQKDG